MCRYNKDELERLQGIIDRLANQLEEMTIRYNSLWIEFDKFHEDYDSLWDEYDSLMRDDESKMKQILEENNKLKATITAKDTELANLTEQFRQLKSECDGISDSYASLRSEYDEFVSAVCHSNGHA